MDALEPKPAGNNVCADRTCGGCSWCEAGIRSEPEDEDRGDYERDTEEDR